MLVQAETQVVQLEVPLEPGRLGEAGVVQRLDLGQVRAVRGDLGEHGVAARVAQPRVLGVDAEIRGEDRVVRDEPPDAGLDEVVEAVVERAGVGRGSGPRERDGGQLVGHRSSQRPRFGRASVSAGGGAGAAIRRRHPVDGVGRQAALGARSPAGCGAVSASAPATAWMVCSTSAAEMP